MRLSEPRVPPLPEDQWSAETRAELLKARRNPDRPVSNVFTTLAHHPKLLKRWLVFGNHVLNKSSLAPRERELAILRTGWLNQSEYEWGQHAAIGRRAGLTDDEVVGTTKDVDAREWSDRDRALLHAVDELHDDSMLTDDTWKALDDHFDLQQVMDVVFAVGQYTMLSMALNSFGVQLDEGVEGFPK